MKKVILYIFGITILFGSCGTHKRLMRLEPVSVVQFCPETLNGSYHNEVVIRYDGYNWHPFGRTLWRTLGNSYSLWDRKVVNASDSAIVNLRFADNRLYAQLVEEGEIIQEIVLRAEVRGNYLSVRRKLLVVPAFPIVFGYFYNKIILTNAESGNLLLKGHHSDFGMMLIMAGGTTNTVSVEFAREKTDE